jgi:3-methyladenine DNA glycosylase AlkD
MSIDILSELRQDLESSIDEKTKNSYQHFFKEEVKAYGVKTPIVENIAKSFFDRIREKSKKDIFSLCEKLLESDYSEEAFIAF